jgi:hypothetical protein
MKEFTCMYNKRNIFVGCIFWTHISFGQQSSLPAKETGNHNLSGCISFRKSLHCDLIYRLSQEERSIFWEITVLVILRKTVYMNMCPIPNGF